MTYRDRREAKADRLREWADKREAKAEAAFTRSDEIAGMIPFGQPILSGHHSEGRHRPGTWTESARRTYWKNVDRNRERAREYQRRKRDEAQSA